MEDRDFKIALQLIDATNGENVWADRWVFSPTDLSSITGRVVEEISNKL